MAKSKFYAVKVGKIPGIYTTWAETETQVKGFQNATYKSFASKEEAEAYLLGETANIQQNSLNINADINIIVDNALHDGYVVAFTDGSYNDKLKKYSYGVFIKTNLEEVRLNDVLSNKYFIEQRNVSGEIFGALKAIDWAVSNNYRKIKLFYDYEGIQKWAHNEWEAKSKIAIFWKNQLNYKFKDIISIEFHKVKAHTGIEYNEVADQLAAMAMEGNKNSKILSNWFVLSNVSIQNLELLVNSVKLKFDNVQIYQAEENDVVKYSFVEVDEIVNLTYVNEKLIVQGKISSLLHKVIVCILLSKELKFKVTEVYSNLYRETVGSDVLNEYLNFTSEFNIENTKLLEFLYLLMNMKTKYLNYSVFTPVLVYFILLYKDYISNKQNYDSIETEINSIGKRENSKEDFIELVEKCINLLK